MDDLKGHIAVVTGSSRGIGKGTAIALGEKGCTVYVTGRSTGDGDRTIDTTARLVTEAGGEGRAIQCDHGNDTEIEALFRQIGDEAGHIDILVNNVYKIPNPPAWGGGFWDHPIQVWDDRSVSACVHIMWPVGMLHRSCSRVTTPACSMCHLLVGRVITFRALMVQARRVWIA